MLKNRVFSLLFFLLLGSPQAFYYSHLLTTVPEDWLKEFSRRHHLSKAFEAIFQRGQEAYNQMDFKRAEQAYNTLLLVNSKDILALDRQAQVYLKQGQFELAIKALTRVLQIDPAYFPAHHHLAHIYLWTKDFRRCVTHCKFLIESSQAWMETYTTLAMALFMMGQLDNLEAVAATAKEAGAKHPLFDFLPAMGAWLQKDSVRYEKHWLTFQANFESSEKLIYEAAFYIVADDKIEAQKRKDAFEKVSWDHPVFPWIQLALGLEMIHYVAPLKSLPAAIESAATKAWEIQPGFVLSYRVPVLAYRRIPDYGRIAFVADKGLGYFPSYTPLQEYLGEAAFFLDQDEIALAALDKSLKVRTDNPNLLSYYAILLLRKKNYDPALNSLEKATALHAGNPYAQTAFGYYYTLTGTPQRGEPFLKEAIGQEIPYPLPWRLLIQAKEENRSYREAYQLALKGRKILPDDKILQERAAALAFLQQEYNNCVFICSEAALKFPNDPFFPIQKAQAYRKLGQPERGIETLVSMGLGGSTQDTTYRLYLDLLMENGQFDEAFAQVSELLSRFPKNRLYLEFEAGYHLANLEFDKALKIYENLDKEHGRARYLPDVGWVNFLMGKNKEALDALTLASNSLSDKDARALTLYRLALVCAIMPAQQQNAPLNYRLASELAPRLEKAREDHEFYLKLVSGDKKAEIVQKNLDLYLR